MMRSRTASVGGGALSGAGSRGSSMPPLDDLFAAAVAAASMSSPLSGRTTGGAAGAWPTGQQQSNGMYSSSVHSLTPRTSVSGGVTPGGSGMTVSTGVGTQANGGVGGVAGVGRLSTTQLPPRPTPSPPASERQPLSPSPSPSVAKAGRTEIETQTGLQVTCEKSFYRRRLMAPAIPFSSSEGECAGLIKRYAFKAEGYVSHIHLDNAILEMLCRDVCGSTS